MAIQRTINYAIGYLFTHKSSNEHDHWSKTGIPFILFFLNVVLIHVSKQNKTWISVDKKMVSLFIYISI